MPAKRILLAILVLPSVLYLILYFTGENEYTVSKPKELVVYNPKSDACPEGTESEHTVPNFSFLNQDKKRITQEDYEGTIYISNFFFTRCPDICIDMSNQLLRVQESFKHRKDIKILSHSIDHYQDTAEVLKEYAELYQADSTIWNFVYGSKEDIEFIAKCGYFIAYSLGDSLINENVQNFTHSDKFVLIDKKSRIRGFYSGIDRKEVDRLITEINILLQEK